MYLYTMGWIGTFRDSGRFRQLSSLKRNWQAEKKTNISWKDPLFPRQAPSDRQT